MFAKKLFVAFALFALVGLTVGCGSKTEKKDVPVNKDCDKGKCVPEVKKDCGGVKATTDKPTEPTLPGVKRVDPSK